MKIAIMQPYFFPYIGYFQMFNVVKEFVFLDDVNFIKKGWIHRNKIQLGNKEHSFTVPLKKASQNKKINEILLHESYDSWKEKFKATLKHAYGKTPNFEEVYPKVCWLLDRYTGNKDVSWVSGKYYANKQLSNLCVGSIDLVFNLLGIPRVEVKYSSLIEVGDNKGADRILRICQQLKATHYINAIGGKELYSQEVFDRAGIDLRFIKCDLEKTEDFNPYMSILDLIFRYPLAEVKEMLYNYTLER